MSDYGLTRRLKRVRSTSGTHNELDAELQASIRSQNHASKRSRISSGGGPRSFSGPFALPSTRASRLIEGESTTSTPSRPSPHVRPGPLSQTVSRENTGSIRSLWTSMSGFFGRERAPLTSVREAVDRYESLQVPSQRPDSAATANSPRDSGVYLDSRPSSRPKQDGGDGMITGAPPQLHRFEPSLALEPPKLPEQQTSDSPLKRLQTASMSGLRKVKSLALRPQPSREDVQKEQCKQLMHRMSTLQNQLDECKQEFARIFASGQMPRNMEEFSAALAAENPMPRLPVPVSPKSDRGTQTIIDVRSSLQRSSNSPLDYETDGEELVPSIEEEENQAPVRQPPTPENWPLPAAGSRRNATTSGNGSDRIANSNEAAKKVVDHVPTIAASASVRELRRVRTRSLRTPEAQIQPSVQEQPYSDIQTQAAEPPEPPAKHAPAPVSSNTSMLIDHLADAENSFLRRSLSTIPSSGDELSSPAPVLTPFPVNHENERPTSARSNRASRIPMRQSPTRRTATSAADETLPQIKAIKSEEDKVAVTVHTQSPKRSRTKKGPSPPKKRLSNGKKVVGSEKSGHYDDEGEWVWGSEAF